MGAAIVALGVGAPSASAISSDYCGYGIYQNSQCWEGSGYRGWRYHQASTGSGGPILPYICAYAWTGSNYRTGSGCTTNYNFYAFQYCSAEPTANSSVMWSGGSGTRVVYGHADSRTCGLAATQEAQATGTLPAYIATRFRDPGSAGQAGVDPATARAVAVSDGVSVFQMGGGKQSCVLRSDAGGWGAGCTTSEQVASDEGRQLLAERVESGGYRLYGLVGAGASKATVVTADGSAAPAAISGAGAIVVTTRSRPTAVTISSGSEQSTVAIAAS